MRTACLLAALALQISFFAAGIAEGQMFGSRATGGSLSRRAQPTFQAGQSGDAAPGASGLTQVGNIQGNERFLRGNRRPGNFVGGDKQERRGFIGALQAETPARVQSAQAGLRIESRTDANRTGGQQSGQRLGMYEPRLALGFDYAPLPARSLSLNLTRHLESYTSLQRLGPIEVSTEGRLATLRGVVASEGDRELAERLILFEPGISAVRNELTVRHSTQNRSANQPAAYESQPVGREF